MPLVPVIALDGTLVEVLERTVLSVPEPVDIADPVAEFKGGPELGLEPITAEEPEFGKDAVLDPRLFWVVELTESKVAVEVTADERTVTDCETDVSDVVGV